MKYNHIQWIVNRPLYVYLKKHYCPLCGKSLKVVHTSKIVHSNSQDADKFDFHSVDNFMVGNVKFVWTEFQCPICTETFAIDTIRSIEKRGKLE